MKDSSLVVRQKGESKNADNKKNKAGKISKKTNISYPLIRTRTCAYQGAFFAKFGISCFLVTSISKFAILPYYQQVGDFYKNE